MKLTVHIKNKTDLTMRAIRMAIYNMETENIDRIDTKPGLITIYTTDHGATFILLLGVIIGRFVDDSEIIAAHAIDWEKDEPYEERLRDSSIG